MVEFRLGVNYWPRNLGVNIWKKWRPKEIAEQFSEMRDMGLDIARVFLLWEDFQPVREYRGFMDQGEIKSIRHAFDSQIVLDESTGYLDVKSLKKFDEMLEIAKNVQIQLIPTLLVGWMSGTCFEPFHLRGRNIFSDPAMLRYQILYLGKLAARYKNEPAIYAWDLGNEQNCFQPCDSRDTAWNWTYTLATTLRSYDGTHKVTSGMHTLSHCSQDKWLIQDVASHCDFTNVHPYPGFSALCMEENLHPRVTYFAGWQTRLYQGVGQKPNMCQEFGTLGNTFGNEERCAKYAGTVLPSLLANESIGALWWCHTDFTCIHDLPYSVDQMEADGLGLTRTDATLKPAGEKFKEFSEFCKKADIEKWSPRAKQAVILLPNSDAGFEQNFAAFILAKQAGINADICRPDVALDEYKLIIIPSISGFRPLSILQWENIMKAVKRGAVLWLSYAGASLKNMEKVFGISILDRLQNNAVPLVIKSAIRGDSQLPDFLYHHSGDLPTLRVECTTGKPLARFEDSSSAIIEHNYGKGKVVFCTVGIEKDLSSRPYGFDKSQAYKLYEYLAVLSDVDAASDIVCNPWIERTFFNTPEGTSVLLINHTQLKEKVTFTNVSGRIVNIENKAAVKKDGVNAEVSIDGNSFAAFLLL